MNFASNLTFFLAFASKLDVFIQQNRWTKQVEQELLVICKSKTNSRELKRKNGKTKSVFVGLLELYIRT